MDTTDIKSPCNMLDLPYRQIGGGSSVLSTWEDIENKPDGSIVYKKPNGETLTIGKPEFVAEFPIEGE